MKRQRGTMSMPLFHKIIDDAATIPPIDKVTLTGLGEPLLDKHLMERLRYIRKHMRIGCLDLYTNGSLLTTELVRQFEDVGVSMLYVSLNAVNSRLRSQVMKLDDYEQVARVLDESIEMTKDSEMKIVVKAVAGSSLMEPGDADAFIQRWGGTYDKGGHAFLHLEGNWAGLTYPMRIQPVTPCSRALEQIMVMWDGRVSLCCFDGEGEVVFGDLNKQSIREIFNGGLALEYREAHVSGRRGEMKLCKSCTTI